MSINMFLRSILFLGILWTVVPPAHALNYVPTTGQCPTTQPSIRDASSGLTASESSFVTTRRQATIPAMQQFFSTLNISGFDAAGYIKSQSNNIANLPNIGIALSGGGYRAMLNGAGVVKALDGRESTSTLLGGLLQSSTYVTGLSGGSWLLSSIYFNNFSTIDDLQDGGPVWNLTTPLFEPVGDTSITAYIKLYETVLTEVVSKGAAGFITSAVDYWGRLLSQRFINAPDFGVSYTWSGIRNMNGFSTGQLPLPIVNAESRVNDQTSWSPVTTTVFEFSPFEFGSWDPSLSSFVDTMYMGSSFSNGKLANQTCVTGYDQAGFIFGTSSALITATLSSSIKGLIPSALAQKLQPLITQIEEDNGLVARYSPNPWNQFETSNAAATGLNSNELSLVDGGTDGSAIPLQPLIQPARAVDIIIAADGTNDVNGFPNGTSLITSYARSKSAIGNNVPFPEIPDANTFVNLGLNKRPTFFGCNSTAPLIVYLPNAPYTTQSNKSTFQFSYTYPERDAMIDNGALIATYGNGSASSEYRVCLGCAILSRSFTRTKTTVPSACQQCFNSYCWNGTYASSTPSQAYAPDLIGANPVAFGLNVSGTSPASSTSSSSSTSTSTSASSSATNTYTGAGTRLNTAATLMLLPALGMFMAFV